MLRLLGRRGAKWWDAWQLPRGRRPFARPYMCARLRARGPVACGELFFRHSSHINGVLCCRNRVEWRKRCGVRAMYAWAHGQRWRSVDAVLTLFHGALRKRWGDGMRRMPHKHHIGSRVGKLSVHTPEQRASVFHSIGQRTCKIDLASAIRRFQGWRGG